MKKKLMLTVATLFVFTMAIVAFAYTTSGTDTAKAAASCCACCGDSCPMKSKDAKAQTTAAGDAKTSCDCSCCKGDSCPMHKKDAKTGTSAAADDTSKGHDCCGDSCPMKKGEHSSHAGMKMQHDSDMKDMKDCSCSCCNHNMDKEKKDTTGV
jgi:hypothetical protein